MDIFTNKAKVRSEQKTYDKNSMLMQKSSDIRANFAECECRYGCEYDCARGCEFERELGFFCEFKLHHDPFKLQFTSFEFL